MGVVVKIQDTEDNEVFAMCYGELMVEKGPEGLYATYTGFLGGAMVAVSLAGLSAGYMLRKRRIGSIDLLEEDPSDESFPGNHFELITDPTSRV
jgi:hypothetical protein